MGQAARKMRVLPRFLPRRDLDPLLLRIFGGAPGDPLSTWKGKTDAYGNLLNVGASSSAVPEVKGSALVGDNIGQSTCAGLLATDTITVGTGSDAVTCSVDGALDIISSGDAAWDVKVYRGGVLWAWWPMANIGKSQEHDASGNGNHLYHAGYTGTEIQEFTDGRGTNYCNEFGYGVTASGDRVPYNHPDAIEQYKPAPIWTAVNKSCILGDGSGKGEKAGILTTSTITGLNDSPSPTCTVDGELTFADTTKYWAFEIYNGATLFGTYYCENGHPDFYPDVLRLQDISGNDNHITLSGFTGEAFGTHDSADVELITAQLAYGIFTGNLSGATFVYSLLGTTNGDIYAGTRPNGDVFKSTDGGNNWVNTGNLSGATFVESLLGTTNGDIYAGTRPNGDVFKSTDGGDNWVNTGELSGATQVYSLLETTNGDIYAGTYPAGDVFKSTDGGDNWVNTGELSGVTHVYSLLGTTNGDIYAGTRPNGDVFKSTDGGDNWVNTGNLSGASFVYSLIETTNGDIYAGTQPLGNVFKSTDGGDNWVNTGNLSGASFVYSLIETTNGDIYAGTFPAGNVFKSTDGGDNWVNTGELSGASYVDSLLETTNGDIYAGTYPNGDVFKSTDGGDNWINTSELNGIVIADENGLIDGVRATYQPNTKAHADNLPVQFNLPDGPLWRKFKTDTGLTEPITLSTLPSNTADMLVNGPKALLAYPTAQDAETITKALKYTGAE